MKLCFGTYGQVLLRCRRNGVTQLELGRGLLYSVNGDTNTGRYDDSTISNLFKGKRNLSPSDVESARYGDGAEITERLSRELSPLLAEDKIPLAIAALKEIVGRDDELGAATLVDEASGLTKEEIVRSSVFDPWRFLAGILMYVVGEAPNMGHGADCITVKGLFTSKLADAARLLTLSSASGSLESLQSAIIWADGPSSLSVIEGDLFSLVAQCAGPKRIAVIPVDTSFSTEMSESLEVIDGGKVSEQTIHGKWLLRMRDDGISIEEVASRIRGSLVMQGLLGAEDEIDVPVGTVAAIDLGGVAYYLLAIARMDADGCASSSEEMIAEAVEVLVRYHDRHGQGYPLYVPLLGTGMSRANLSIAESYEILVSTLTVNRSSIHGNVAIVSLPGKWHELGIDRAEAEDAV